MITSTLVISGTVINLTTGDAFAVALGLPIAGDQIIASTVGLLVILGLIAWVYKFEMRLMTFELFFALLYLPLSLTAFGVYYILLALTFLIGILILRFFGEIIEVFK